jgi:hypothetical protein
MNKTIFTDDNLNIPEGIHISLSEINTLLEENLFSNINLDIEEANEKYYLLYSNKDKDYLVFSVDKFTNNMLTIISSSHFDEITSNYNICDPLKIRTLESLFYSGDEELQIELEYARQQYIEKKYKINLKTVELQIKEGICIKQKDSEYLLYSIFDSAFFIAKLNNNEILIDLNVIDIEDEILKNKTIVFCSETGSDESANLLSNLPIEEFIKFIPFSKSNILDVDFLIKSINVTEINTKQKTLIHAVFTPIFKALSSKGFKDISAFKKIINNQIKFLENKFEETNNDYNLKLALVYKIVEEMLCALSDKNLLSSLELNMTTKLMDTQLFIEATTFKKEEEVKSTPNTNMIKTKNKNTPIDSKRKSIKEKLIHENSSLLDKFEKSVFNDDFQSTKTDFQSLIEVLENDSKFKAAIDLYLPEINITNIIDDKVRLDYSLSCLQIYLYATLKRIKGFTLKIFFNYIKSFKKEARNAAFNADSEFAKKVAAIIITVHKIPTSDLSLIQRTLESTKSLNTEKLITETLNLDYFCNYLCTIYINEQLSSSGSDVFFHNRLNKKEFKFLTTEDSNILNQKSKNKIKQLYSI